MYGKSGSKDTGHIKECQTSLNFVSFIPTTDKIDTTREKASLKLETSDPKEILRNIQVRHDIEQVIAMMAQIPSQLSHRPNKQ